MIRFLSGLTLGENALIKALRELLDNAPQGTILFIGDHDHDGLARYIDQLMDVSWTKVEEISFVNYCPAKGSREFRKMCLIKMWPGCYQVSISRIV